MTYIISGCLIVINIFNSLMKKNNLIKWLLLIMMWVLFWGNFKNPDYGNYLLHYDYITLTGNAIGTSEFGFAFLMKIAIFFNLEYYQFLMLFTGIGLLLIVSTVEKYAIHPQLVYALYFIYPFILDIVQLKHYLAMAIVVFCFRYLENKEIKNIIKFLIGILIAFSIHYISLIFIPLLFLVNLKTEKIYTIMFFYLVIGIPLAYTNIYEIFASYLVPVLETESYFLNRAHNGFILQIFIQSGVLILIYLSKRFLDKHNYENNIVNIIYKANILLLILFPLYIINGTFSRAFRMLAIPNYIMFSIVFSKINRKEKALFLMCLLIFVILLFLYYIFVPAKNNVLFPIFENNLLFK